MTVYLIGSIQNRVCLDADERPSVEGVPIGSRITVADTGVVEMYVGDYYAEGLLEITDGGEADDTILLGSVTLTLVAADPEAGQVVAGTDLASRVAAAVNGTDGINSANADISAEVVGADVRVIARVAGDAGNALASVYTAFDVSTNAFTAATLAGGYDPWQALP